MRIPILPAPLTPAGFHARFPDSDEEPSNFFHPDLACQHCGGRRVTVERAVVKRVYCRWCGTGGTLQSFTLPGLDAYFSDLGCGAAGELTGQKG